MIQKRKLRIELKSDLSSGSGYSYAGLIDSDISYDQYGIPVILGRRLKGCMRETAESTLYRFITDDEVKRIFGAGKYNHTTGIMIGNAYPMNAQQVRKEIECINTCDMFKAFREYITQNEILDAYTSVKAQTAINKESQTAVDNSLRYTRVVNDVSPIDGSPLVFEADIEFDNKQIDYKLEKKLEKIVKATRNIGQSRNRGLGSVKCTLIKEKDSDRQCNVKSEDNGSGKCVISLIIRNEQPLMMSGMNDNESLSYIPGQVVLGALAGKYLANSNFKGDAFDDSTFRKLFLSGDTIFTDLVPYKNGRVYYPAPLFVNILKKSKKYVNAEYLNEVMDRINKERKSSDSDHSYEKDIITSDFAPVDGNVGKKLRGKYLYLGANNDVSVYETATDLVYHHSHRGMKNGVKGVLHPLEVIREQQYFAGRIIVSKDLAKIVRGLLRDGILRLGKSKSAQYGKCVIETDANNPFDLNNKVDFSANTTFMVQLVSDAVFVGEQDYTVDYRTVKRLIADQLNLTAQNASESVKFHDMLEIGEVAGYQTQWNLRKAPMPVVKAGSVFVFEMKKDISLSQAGFIGERNHEGFGEYRIVRLSGNPADYKMSLLNPATEQININQREDDNKPFEALYPIIKDRILDHMREKVKLRALHRSRIGLSATHVGKMMLMLNESLEGNKTKGAAFADFQKRVEEVKSDDRDRMRRDGLEYVAREIGSIKDKKSWGLSKESILDGYRDDKDETLSVSEEYRLLLKLVNKQGFSDAEERAEEELLGLWSEYVRALLINAKYQMKEQ